MFGSLILVFPCVFIPNKNITYNCNSKFIFFFLYGNNFSMTQLLVRFSLNFLLNSFICWNYSSQFAQDSVSSNNFFTQYSAFDWSPAEDNERKKYLYYWWIFFGKENSWSGNWEKSKKIVYTYTSLLMMQWRKEMNSDKKSVKKTKVKSRRINENRK